MLIVNSYSYLLLLGFVSVVAVCPLNLQGSLPFVLEYSLWRGWQQAILYAPSIEYDCNWAIIRLIKCLSVNGVAVATPKSVAEPRVKFHVGVIVLAPNLRDVGSTALFTKFMKEFSNIEMNIASYDWLITARSSNDLKNMNDVLNATFIRFDQNLIVSYTKGKRRLTGLCENNFVYGTKENRYYEGNSHRYYGNRNNCRFGNRFSPNCSYGRIDYERNYYKASPRFRNLIKNRIYLKSGNELPLLRSGFMFYNYSKKFQMVNASRFALGDQSSKKGSRTNYYRHNNDDDGVYMVQYFKVRPNSTLYAYQLGMWSHDQSMSRVETPYPVEARSFLGEELRVGRCNTTGEGPTALEDDGPAAPELIDDVLLFLTVQLNATASTRYFSKLGFRTYEGTWTGLLGALVGGTVDVALEPVTAHSTRQTDMDFIFPIAETMCNIYIRHQETSTVRDIFLAPFSVRLLVCVVAVAVVSALLVMMVSRLTPTLRVRRRPMEFAEALLWSTGILCQQGGTWTPPSPAASTLLIVCLLFAVVTYNSYAAFITSVLSVRVASVDTVGAVLHSSNFKIGYIKNGADQMYLMSTKDAQLNAFYIRGYSDAENLVTSVEEGLSRAARQDYAFFAGQRSARTTLRALSQARGRCSLRELPVPSTKAQLAFPLLHRSPYAKPTLLSLLSLRSGGALALLSAALVPSMPECAPPPGFASARATDVRSALFLLALGLATALLLGISEYCWKNRRDLRKYVYERCYNRIVNLQR